MSDRVGIGFFDLKFVVFLSYWVVFVLTGLVEAVYVECSGIYRSKFYWGWGGV